MTSLRVMFMFSVLFVFVHAFPQSTKDLEHKVSSKSDSETTDFQANHSTTSMPEEITPIVEFVYKVLGNYGVETGTDRQKYSISPYSEKSLLNTAEKQTMIKKNSNSYSTDIDYHSIASNKITHNRKLFFPEETSIITESLPKYFYDIYSPILPFPEMNEAQKQKSRNEKLYSSFPLAEEKTNQPPHVAGPVLSPIGIARQFDLPFFQ